jgi:2-polyprenyl-6-hydroxyphenyl methylase/3-demethylubiquinone-9 3-methyltransferase
VVPVRGSVTEVPLRDGCADVVVAGEILEHVTDLPAAVAQACRLLRPGGLLVIDTLAATTLARLVAIRLAELLPAVPKGIHDPRLLVDRTALVRECARHGVALTLRGIAPSVPDLARWLLRRVDTVRMTSVRTTAILFQATGRKAVS